MAEEAVTIIDATDPMRMMCGNCEADIKQRYVWFSNQYGQKMRFFCRECGCWEDRKLIYGKSFTYNWVPFHGPDDWRGDVAGTLVLCPCCKDADTDGSLCVDCRNERLYDSFYGC